MKIPFKMSRLTIRHARVRNIILHHTKCLYPAPFSKIDNSEFQLKAIANNVLEDKTADFNFHYVIDKIKDDYYPIICRPFVTMCEFPDIDPNINYFSIHVALMGSYDFKVPEPRLYEVLAYRVLNPLLKIYRLAPNKVLFHNEVSDNKELSCPGLFLKKDVIVSMIRKFVMVA